MQAISEIIELNGPILHYTLPEGFDAKRIQLIILPADLPAEPIIKKPGFSHYEVVSKARLPIV